MLMDVSIITRLLIQKPRKGIKELRFIDPRKIKKVREQRKEKDPKTGLDFVKVLMIIIFTMKKD